MDRKILFRAKSTFDNKWVYGGYVSYDFMNDGLIYSNDVTAEFVEKNGLRAIEPIRVAGETVCRFTGLVDVKGKKIFEGDIVETFEIVNQIHEVACVRYGEECYDFGRYMDEDEGYVGFYLDPSVENPLINNGIRYWLNSYGIRILGNIYDDLWMVKKHKFDVNYDFNYLPQS